MSVDARELVFWLPEANDFLTVINSLINLLEFSHYVALHFVIFHINLTAMLKFKLNSVPNLNTRATFARSARYLIGVFTSFFSLVLINLCFNQLIYSLLNAYLGTAI